MQKLNMIAGERVYMEEHPQRKIQAVFRRSGPEYKKSHILSPEQEKALWNISCCGTSDMGLSVCRCDACGSYSCHYLSCRDRNCPGCGGLDNVIWEDKAHSYMITSTYYHCTFTIPSELRDLYKSNKKLLYDLLHKCSSSTLLEMYASRNNGAQPGIIQAFQSWGSDLKYHPHVHCIISATGLSKDRRSLAVPKDFFLPAKAVADLFRGKMLSQLGTYFESNKLRFAFCKKLEQPENWYGLIHKLYEKDWNFNIKETYNGNGNALDYIGRYINRIAITDARVESIEDGMITFRYKDYKNDGNIDSMTLSDEEFISRFMEHVLPKGFQKVRYYGYLNNRYRNENLEIIAELQDCEKQAPQYAGMNKLEILEKHYNKDPFRCPHCHESTLSSAKQIPAEELKSHLIMQRIRPRHSMMPRTA